MAFDSKSGELDSLDWRILNALQRDARLSMAKLGRSVGLSPPAVAQRVRHLEDVGIIVGYRAMIDPRAMGKTVIAFIRITSAGNIKEKVRQAVLQTPEVLECYRGSGGECFTLKVAVENVEQLEAVSDRFTQFGTIATTIVLSALLENRIIEEPPSD